MATFASDIQGIQRRINKYRALYPRTVAQGGTPLGWSWVGDRIDDWVAGGTGATAVIESKQLKLVTSGSGYIEATVNQSASSFVHAVLACRRLTTAGTVRLQWITQTDGTWDNTKSVSFSVGTTLADLHADLGAAWSGTIVKLRISVDVASTLYIDYLLVDTAGRDPNRYVPKQTAVTAAQLNALRQDIETLKSASVTWENAVGETGANLRAVAGRTFERPKHWDDLRARLTEVEASCWNSCNTCNTNTCPSCHAVGDAPPCTCNVGCHGDSCTSCHSSSDPSSCSCNTACYSQTCGCHTSCYSDACGACHSSSHSCSCNTSCYSQNCSYCHTGSDAYPLSAQGGSWACGGSCNSNSCAWCNSAGGNTCNCHAYCNTDNCTFCHGTYHSCVGWNTCDLCDTSANGWSCGTDQCQSCHGGCNGDACAHCHAGDTCASCHAVVCDVDVCSSCHGSTDSCPCNTACHLDGCSSCHGSGDSCSCNTLCNADPSGGCHACNTDSCAACHGSADNSYVGGCGACNTNTCTACHGTNDSGVSGCGTCNTDTCTRCHTVNNVA